MSGSATQTPTGGNPSGTASFQPMGDLKPIIGMLGQMGLSMPKAQQQIGHTGATPPRGMQGMQPSANAFQTPPMGGNTSGLDEATIQRYLAMLQMQQGR